MSLRIIRAGILDTIQDQGRYGYQHLGINPCGCMDKFAAQVANMLVGNEAGDAVIELHFPAASLLFESATLVAIGGADFSPTVNGEEVPLWQPILVSKNSILQFQQWRSGSRSYLAIREQLDISKWLGSYSTNLKAGCGGFNGRALKKEDVIPFAAPGPDNYKTILKDREHFPLPWRADINWFAGANQIAVVRGHEWNWLTTESQDKFSKEFFTVSSAADRMGYKLEAAMLSAETEELISSAVGFGTIQLLPSGDLMVLMADHQTTGGYPRVAHVASASLSQLAQARSGDKIRFQFVDIEEAEKLKLQQKQHLLQLQNACTFRLKQFMDAHN